MFLYLASWLSRSFEFFESTGLGKAAEIAREVDGAEPPGGLNRNARVSSLAPEGLEEVMVARRLGDRGLPAWQGVSAVRLGGHECERNVQETTARSWTLGKRIQRDNLHPGTCNANHIIRAVSS